MQDLSTFDNELRARALKHEVDLARAQAIGYVWGLQDRGEDGDIMTSLAFGDAYASHKCTYLLEQATFCPNIRDAYQQWRKTRTIVEP